MLVAGYQNALVCHGLPWSNIVCLGLPWSALEAAVLADASLAAAGLPLCNAGCRMQNVKRKMQNAGCRMQGNAGGCIPLHPHCTPLHTLQTKAVCKCPSIQVSQVCKCKGVQGGVRGCSGVQLGEGGMQGDAGDA